MICQQKGFKNCISGTGFQSRLWATDKLKAHFQKAKFSHFAINHHYDWDPTILRDQDKKNKEYDDTVETNRMRSMLLDYIKILENTHIYIYDLDTPVLTVGTKKRKMRLQIGQQDKLVRRVFNNLRWDQGGRFYGG